MILYVENNIIYAEAETQKELALSFFRLSEFQEGKDGIKGQKFSTFDFMSVYFNEKGEIDFFNYWDGFNIKKETITQFIIIQEEFTPVEKEIFYFILSNMNLNNYYLIGYLKGDEITKRHESIHAKFCLDIIYAQRVRNLILYSSLFPSLRDSLINYHYEETESDEYFADEINAYLCSSEEIQLKEEIFIDIDYSSLKEELIKLL